MSNIIEKIVYPGRSLSRPGGKVVFTDEGLPGEEVELDVVREKKDYVEARTRSVVKASPDRTGPRCGHYKACSPYQYIKYPRQLEIKKSQVAEALLRALKKDAPEVVLRPSPELWHYRNKIDLKLVWNDKKPSLAYAQPGSNNSFIGVDKCHLASERAWSFLEAFMTIARRKAFREVSGVMLKENSDSSQMLLVLYSDKKVPTGEIASALAVLGNEFPLNGAVISSREKRQRYKILLGEDYITQELDGLKFRIGPLSFFQVNIPAFQLLMEDLERSLALGGTESLADLYCGVGTFGILLASKVSRVFGVEYSGENIPFLRKNLEVNGINNFTVCEGDCDQWISRVLKEDIDVLVVDPPRKGISDHTLKNVLKNPPGTIAYISCDPATFSRDLAKLLEQYAIKDLFAYDFFPHTPHIETLAVLEAR